MLQNDTVGNGGKFNVVRPVDRVRKRSTRWRRAHRRADVSLSRRTMLRGAAGVVAASGLPALAAQSTLPGADDFQILEAAQRPEPHQSLLAYHGMVPGPMIRLKKGDELRVRLVNRLDLPTTLHWHGYRAPSAMDGAAGVTQAAVAPGASFDYRFKAADSGTFWYRPGQFNEQMQQIETGLFGPLIIDEAVPPPVHRDLAVVLHNKPVPGLPPNLMVNGASLPLEVTQPPASRLRVRLINATATRITVVSFDGLKPMIAAIDGQPCELFAPVRASVPLGPGARADVFAELPAEPPARLILRGDGEADQDIVRFLLKGDTPPGLPPLVPLPANDGLPSDIDLARAKRLDLIIDAAAPFRAVAAPGSKGRESEVVAGKPVFGVKRGTAVSLGFRNVSAAVHNLHVHGHTMRLLHPLDDGWEPYWRDSLLLAPGKTARVAFVADNPGKWVIEAAPLAPPLAVRYAFFEVT
jgi:FtsP/CotA-like multicopper oxidase with cupredoxin domain